MTDQPGWTSPGSSVPPGWSPRQPPPSQPPGWGPPGPDWMPPPGSVPPGMGPPGMGPVPYGPKPGIVPLRPLGLGEILDGAVSYIRRSPKATLGLSAIFTAVAVGIQLLAEILFVRDITGLLEMDPASFTGPGDVLGTFASSLVGLLSSALIGSIVTLVLTGMLTVVVGRAVLGQTTTMGDAWREAGPRILPLIGVSLLTGLLRVAAVLICLVPGLVALLAQAPTVVYVVLIALGVIGAIAAYAWVYVTFALAAPAVVLERAGVITSLGRSRALTRHDFWRVLGILLLTWIITIVLGLVLQAPFSIVQQVLAVGGATGGDVTGGAFVAGLVVSALGGIVAGTVVNPFSAGVYALLYVDQRMRREGLDMELQAAAGVGGRPGHGRPTGLAGHPGYGGATWPSGRPGPPGTPTSQGW